jgi:hypothetical protein
MIELQFFGDFDFRLVLPDAPTYTPATAGRERPYCPGLNPAEVSAPSFVDKLHLFSKN